MNEQGEQVLCRADIKNGRITGEVLKVNRNVSKGKKEITSVIIRILPGEDAYNAGKIIKRHIKRHNVYIGDEVACKTKQEQTQAISL
jgi:hypothetical protein